MARINVRNIVFAIVFSITSGITAIIDIAIALHILSQY